MSHSSSFVSFVEPINIGTLKFDLSSILVSSSLYEIEPYGSPIVAELPFQYDQMEVQFSATASHAVNWSCGNATMEQESEKVQLEVHQTECSQIVPIQSIALQLPSDATRATRVLDVKDDGEPTAAQSLAATVAATSPKRCPRNPWTCEVCHKTLTSDRRRHMNTHVNDVKYHCWRCFKGTGQPSNLIGHKCKHGSRQIRCGHPGCLFRAASADELSKHTCASQCFLVLMPDNSQRIPALEVEANPDQYVPPQPTSAEVCQCRPARKRTAASSFPAESEQRVRARLSSDEN